MLLMELRALVASFLGLGRLHMGFLPLVECHAFLPEGLSVGNSWNPTSSWDLNQASCSWPPSGDLTRHLQACAGGLGQIVSGSSLLVCCFSILKWLEKMGKQCFSQNAALQKLQMSKTFPSLYFQDRNLQSSFLLSCWLWSVISIMCFSELPFLLLNVAIATYFERETKRIVHKNSFMENLPGQSCPIFYRTTLTLAMLCISRWKSKQPRGKTDPCPCLSQDRVLRPLDVSWCVMG